MAREWTADQKRAIELVGRDLLVSAGAGSGKTSVMAERIISRICDPVDPVRLDQMLIVTFTVAAAGELRERITSGLRERIALGERSRALMRQLDNIGSANISTINSFCLDIVRRHFAELGLPASMRVADDAESDIISEDVMNETLELFFARGEELGISDFDLFCENFINERDESLVSSFLSIYKKLLSLPEGVSILKDKSDAISCIDENNFFDSVWGKVLSERVYSLLGYYKKIYESAVVDFSGDEVLEHNYLTAFSNDLELIDSIVANRDKLTYDELRRTLASHSFVMLGRKKLPADADRAQIEFYKDIRNKFKADHTDICVKSLLTMPSDKIPMLGKLSAEVISGLYTFLAYFEKRLLERKAAMGILTFSDCERYAIQLLSYPDGLPTPVALEYRERFREIYIDEYQDTNKLQDSIFTLISRPGGRFMVGDIKQSIYAFRSADPTLFADYRDSWQPYYEGDESTANSIYLSANFRSSPKIINTVNSVFTPLFSHAGNINYRQEDELLSPVGGDLSAFDDVTVAIVSNEVLECDDPDNVKSAPKKQIRRDAEYLACEVSRLVADGEKLSDIAVLVRNRSSMQYVESALKEYGIPYDSASDSEFFSLPEIRLVLSVLHTIDNPTREIHLIATLTSPLYSLTPDELALLRAESDKALSLYEIVMDSDNPKLVRFRRDLDVWREKARRMPSDKLIRWLYNEYAIINAACVGRDKANRILVKTNCEKIYDIARTYENSSYKGLYSFLEYAATLSGSNSSISVPALASENCVRIMTIHNSKGLEFKNCFIYGASNSLKKKGKSDDILFSKSLGFGMYVREKDSPYRFDTPFRAAISCDNEDKQIEEELRILYVAMTRAKERLWIIGSASKPWEVVNKAEAASEFLDAKTLYTEQNYLFWILAALSARPNGHDWEIREECAPFTPSSAFVISEDPTANNDPAEYLDALNERFSFKYSANAFTRIPAKLSVSRLYPGVLDEEDNSSDLETAHEAVLRRPVFDGGLSDNRAASVGTATHLFMQFCDFGILNSKGVEYELSRLRAEMFLSEEIASLVSKDAIKAFTESCLFGEILSSSSVWRERRFNVLLPAAEFVTDPDDKIALANERMLVQGVVDCVYTDADGKMVLVDYKTDSVRGMSRKEAETMLRQRHSLQLGYYKKALEKLTGAEVSKTLIYSFGLGDTVEL